MAECFVNQIYPYLIGSGDKGEIDGKVRKQFVKGNIRPWEITIQKK